MKVKGVSPDGKAQMEFDSISIDSDYINRLSGFGISEGEVRKVIDRLSVSADVKSLLYSISAASITIGRQVVRIGQKIIDFVCKLLSEFPKLAFFALLGAIVGLLLGSIPILGLVLGPIVTPLAIAVGGAFGAFEDLQDQALKRKIKAFHDDFSPLGQA